MSLFLFLSKSIKIDSEAVSFLKYSWIISRYSFIVCHLFRCTAMPINKKAKTDVYHSKKLDKSFYMFPILNWHIDVSVSRLIFALLQQCKNENLFKILLSFTKKLKSNCQQIFSVLWRKVMILIQNEKGWSILNEKRLQLTKPEKLLCPYFANISQQINMSRECQKW